MITSKQILNFSEEWILNVYGVPAYKNPTSSDFLELHKLGVTELRFICDLRNRNVYVCDALKVIHLQMMTALHLPPDMAKPLLLGVAKLQGNKAVMVNSDQLENQLRKLQKGDYSYGIQHGILLIIKQNWKWCEKYISVSDYLAKIKLSVDKILG